MPYLLRFSDKRYLAKDCIRRTEQAYQAKEWASFAAVTEWIDSDQARNQIRDINSYEIVKTEDQKE